MTKSWQTESQFNLEFSKFELHKRSELRGLAHIPPTFHPDEGILFRHLLWRRKLNMNSIILIVGGVRTGKSVAGLKICERYAKLVGKKYDVKKQCGFEPVDYLEWVNDGATDDAYFLDELGASISPQLWFTQQSRIFNTYTQIGGYRLNLLVMATPSISYLLKSVRNLLNYVIEMYSQGRGVVCKVKMIHRYGKGYLPIVGNLKVSLPRKEVLAAYELKKRLWNEERLDKDIKILKADNIKRDQKQLGYSSEFQDYQPVDPQILAAMRSQKVIPVDPQILARQKELARKRQV